MKICLTFNQNARAYSWFMQNRDLCKQVTGKTLLDYIAKPITDRDLGPLTYTHCEFPNEVQWWVNKHCPYGFVKLPARAKLKTKGLNWYVYKMPRPLKKAA